MQQLTSRPQTPMYPNANIPPRPTHTGDRSSVVLVTALLLFAFAGLLSGFAVGVINRPNHTQANTGSHSSQANNPGVPSKTNAPQKTPTVNIVPLGCPIPDVYVPFEVADGQTAYTASAYATDHTGSTCAGKQLNNSGITFKVWLTQQIPLTQYITFPQGAQNIFTNINNPIEGKSVEAKDNKVDGDLQDLQGLQFVGSGQVQKSNAQGRVTWKYTLPTSLHSGNYTLVFLADWQGKQYNWSWRTITVKGAGGD